MYNQMPADWTQQIREAYPKRSGPCGWGGMRLMMAVRKALLNTDWETIMQGVKGYATYCDQSGKTGSEFVKAPQNFFEDAIYLEELVYQAPQTKEDQERARLAGLAGERMQRAIDGAIQAGSTLRPYPQESVGAYETRCALAQTRTPAIPDRGRDSNGKVGTADRVPGEISTRVSSLANRMRVA